MDRIRLGSILAGSSATLATEHFPAQKVLRVGGVGRSARRLSIPSAFIGSLSLGDPFRGFVWNFAVNGHRKGDQTFSIFRENAIQSLLVISAELETSLEEFKFDQVLRVIDYWMDIRIDGPLGPLMLV
ncbi:hypothetical protein AVEN_78083-1 [Araneus ventricosus]|uniref:Uncharacterized protein n=1 Tax=Araneus ventricosus TaxID=182803 RepID=A0A4Y2F8L7_ARAVE|nr:hypothetical protein AVEN_78083-1 [Araneus ventricosus]